jgi:hypothetical protein
LSDVPGNPIPMVFRCGGKMQESGEDCNNTPLTFGNTRWKHTKKALDLDHTALPVQVPPEPNPVEIG